MTVASQSIYRWAFESRIDGAISAQSVAEAAEQYQYRSNGAQVWLIDAGNASGFSPDALSAIQHYVAHLKPLGLDRIAIVLPEQARPFFPAVQASIPIQVVGFNSRGEAMAWIRRGCR